MACRTVRRGVLGQLQAVKQDSTNSQSNPNRRYSVLMLSSMRTSAANPLPNTNRPAQLASGSAAETIARVQDEGLGRRVVVISSMGLVAQAWNQHHASAQEPPPSEAFREVVSEKQRYKLQVPTSWEGKDKMGADALFEDPTRRSTSAGITVNPVRVASIQDFGTVDDVGNKLLASEKAKDGYIAVELLRQGSRPSTSSSAEIYEFEYELESTRGRKRIINVVTIFNSKLYILNGVFKCSSNACGGDAQPSIETLRGIASTFDVLA